MRIVAAVALVLLQASHTSPLEGEWRTDLPPNLRSMSMAVPFSVTISVTANAVKITDRMVSPNGETWRAGEAVYQTDGKPHPSATENGWTVVATWTTPSVLDVRFRAVRVEDGVTRTVRNTYAVSADQRTLTRRYASDYNGYTDERVFYR